MNNTKVKRKTFLPVSIPACILFLFLFGISTHVTDLFVDFLKTQDVTLPKMLPINVTLSTSLLIAGGGILLECILIVIVHAFQYDKIKKALLKLCYFFGHLLICLPCSFLALYGMSFLITKLFEAAPFEVWNIAYLIVLLALFCVVYPVIGNLMESMADRHLGREKKNHSLSVYLQTEQEPVLVREVLKNKTFSTCYQCMKTNLSDLKPFQIYIISQHGVGSSVKHQWCYDQKGNIIK